MNDQYEYPYKELAAKWVKKRKNYKKPKKRCNADRVKKDWLVKSAKELERILKKEFLSNKIKRAAKSSTQKLRSDTIVIWE